MIAIGAFLVLLAIALGTMQTGLPSSSERVNPNPGTETLAPLWGVTNWPLILSLGFPVVAIAIVVALVRMSARIGKPHAVLIVFTAVMAMGALDPIGNWVTFTVFNPQLPHFPLTWPWMRLAPTVEPVLALFGGYPTLFLGCALVTFWAYGRFVKPRVRAGSWPARHPLTAMFLFVFICDVPIDTGLQLFMMRVGMFMYTQGVGPNIEWINGVTFPIVWGFYDWFLIACIAVLLVRDDRGESMVLSKLARTTGDRSGSATVWRQAAVGAVLMIVLTGVPLAFYAALRVGGLTHPVFQNFPYPEAGMYDPYGVLDKAGKPGPFYK